MAQQRISISSDWGNVTADLADNDAARALARMLPVTLPMRDHLRQEKTGNLASPLPCLFIKRHPLAGHDQAVMLSSGRRGRGFGLSLSGW